MVGVETSCSQSHRLQWPHLISRTGGRQSLSVLGDDSYATLPCVRAGIRQTRHTMAEMKKHADPAPPTPPSSGPGESSSSSALPSCLTEAQFAKEGWFSGSATTAPASASAPAAASTLACPQQFPGAATKAQADAGTAEQLGGPGGSSLGGCSYDDGPATTTTGAESSGKGKGKGIDGVGGAAEGVPIGGATGVGGGGSSLGNGDAPADMMASLAAVIAGSSSVGGGAGGGGSGGSTSSGGGGSSERYNWMPSLRESKPSRECIRRVRNDIRSLMRYATCSRSRDRRSFYRRRRRRRC